QVTSAIRQAGANQVSVITSSAEREASIEFGKAAAIRPNTLGKALQDIAQDPAVTAALFEILETKRLVENGARVVMLAAGAHNRVLGDILAAGAPEVARVSPPPVPPVGQ